MKALERDIQQRFNFIDRTLTHAVHACQQDDSVPNELFHFIQQLDEQSGQAKKAFRSKEVKQIQECVNALALLSDRVQKTITYPTAVSFEVKSAVILAHLEIATLMYQVH